MVSPRLVSSSEKLGVGLGTINEPEIKFECHNKTIPLCAERLHPNYEIPGEVCVLRLFKAKHPQRQKYIVIHTVVE